MDTPGNDDATRAALRRFVERVPRPAVFTDRRGRFLAVSAAGYELLGHEPGSLLGVDALGLVHPDDLARVRDKLAVLVAGSRDEALVFRMRRDDGTYGLIDAAATNLLDDPELEGILVFVDGTPGRPAAGWFEAVVDRSSDYALVLDRELRILYIGGRRVEPAAGSRLVGRRLADLLSGSLGAQAGEWLATVASTPGVHPPVYLPFAETARHGGLAEIHASNLLDDDRVGAIVLSVRDVSDEQEAKLAALAAHELVERSPLMVVTALPDGRVLSWNAAAERILGWTAEEVLGRSLLEIGLVIDPPALARSELVAAVAAGETVDNETKVLNRAGEPVPVFLSSSAQRTESGAVERVLFLGLDLGDLASARSETAAVEARWAAVHARTRELVATVDEDGHALYVGPGFLNVLGHGPATLVGTSLRDLLHPDHQTDAGMVRTMLESGRREATASYRMRHADGSWRVIRFRAADLRDDPTIGAFLFHGVDITERVAAEETNQRLAHAIDTAGAIVVLTDLDRRIVVWNQGAEQLFGVPASEAIGQVQPMSPRPEASWYRRTAVEDRVYGGETVLYESHRINAQGDPVELSVVGTPVRDTAGLIVGASWIGFDVTEARAAARDREQRAIQQAVVAELGQRALAGASVQDLLAEACELVAATLAVDHVLVLVPEGEHLVAAAACGPLSAALGVARVRIEDARTVEEARRLGHPVAIERYDAPDEWDEAAVGPAPNSTAVSTMEGRHGLIGAVAVFSDLPRVFGPTDLDFLQAVSTALGSAVERQRVDEEMRYRALHDELTGLPNRTLLLDRLSQALGRAKRHDELVGLLFVDLDRFKRVNDTLGHATGDEVLAEAARRLSIAVRGGDTVARVGGDEFLVLCEEVAGADEAKALAGRLGASLLAPFRVADHEVVVTASVGIAVADGSADAESVVADADLAMYRAKQRGRARSEVFDEAMREEVVARLEIEEALRGAIDGGGIKVAFQPVLDLSTGRIVSFEALARWDHPRFGPVAPPEFLAVAQEVGLLDDVGAAVLDLACRALVDLRAIGGDALTMAVNVSAQQLTGPHLPGQLAAALATHGLDAGALVVELTETDVIDDQAAQAAIGGLRELGVSVSIDDFGTGYSSLQRVTRLPVDEIKIDQSFVQGIVADKGASAVVRATITLADALGMRLVAEGIERPEQLASLADLGCRYGQGWLFSGPLPIDELTAWLSSRSSSTSTST